MKRFMMAAALILTSAAAAMAAEGPKRDVSKYKASSVKIDTDLQGLKRAEAPNQVAIATATCSTFDLKSGEVMHLHFFPESPVVEVWPLLYLGDLGGARFYVEDGGSPYAGWIWIFTNDKIYFLADGTLREFGETKYFNRIP